MHYATALQYRMNKLEKLIDTYTLDRMDTVNKLYILEKPASLYTRHKVDDA